MAVSLRLKVITQQIIPPASHMTYSTIGLLFILTASCTEDENDVISSLHMGNGCPEDYRICFKVMLSVSQN